MRFLLVILKMSTSPTQSAAGAASHRRYGLTPPAEGHRRGAGIRTCTNQQRPTARSCVSQRGNEMSTFSLKDHQGLRSEGHVQKEERESRSRCGSSGVCVCGGVVFDLAGQKGAELGPWAAAWRRRTDDLAEFIAALLLLRPLKTCQVFVVSKLRKELN